MAEWTCNLDNLVSTLKQFGVAIVPNILDAKECKALEDGLWDHFDYICSAGPTLKRGDPTTWKKALQGTLMPNHGMLCQFHNVGQCQAVWDIRGNPRVQAGYHRIFPKANGKLTVSFDGVSFGLAPEHTGIGWHTKNWLHCDQGWGKMAKTRVLGKRRAVQSWVTAFDIGEGDGTLQVLVGSHKFHKEFARVFHKEEHSVDWYKLEEKEVRWFVEEKGCHLRNIECPAGSQVFWDSRTIHAGRAPLRGRQNTGRNRFVVYICYSPRNWLSAKFAAKKRDYLQQGRMTSHWAHWPKLFAKTPRTYGKPLPPCPPFRPPQLTVEQLLLAGHTVETAKEWLRPADTVGESESG